MGLSQATLTGKALCPANISAVYTSPLKRALKTAAGIAACTERPLITMEELIDIDFGEFQGLTTAEAFARNTVLMQTWLDQPQLVDFPGGENLSVVEGRGKRAIDRAKQEHPDGTVVMVSHSVVCRVMVCHVIGLDLSHFWQIDQATGAINVFETRNNQLVASKINDTCHLKA